MNIVRLIQHLIEMLSVLVLTRIWKFMPRWTRIFICEFKTF
jgi:hypothetical protein